LIFGWFRTIIPGKVSRPKKAEVGVYGKTPLQSFPC
jgi:hypothetical protein